ncbi:MAG: hypothetical protein GY727_07745 [Gammaproteobacteria bacterium]|nr:hypothetical protein [Gammaproteobacteria bacterium]MCP4090171.1 hypothetical protein [Gammaproteobacteria bacterium]MCP4277942.1 hypothetical protein [Gammaproteobacteria bacterium]MCP4832537.1 hypothetical protein [Gammaproteobacteria bacterium]MCP4928681.1 hypothetical protein [Gammaproteobacteria bacterium]
MLLRFLSLTILSLLYITDTQAQQIEGTANFAYGIFTGTGRYKVRDRTLYAVRVPLFFNGKVANYETKEIGYRILAPVSFGITNYNKFNDLPDLDINDLSTITLAPGLEVIVPLTTNWDIKPFAQGGFGWDTQSSANSLLWGVGSRTRAWFNDKKLIIGAELLFAGNDPGGSASRTRFTRIGAGAEYKWNTNWQVFGQKISWHPRLIQWVYINPVNIEQPRFEEKIKYATEIGLSFGINKPIDVLGFAFSQGGIAYEKGDNYDAIKLYTTFPF